MQKAKKKSAVTRRATKATTFPFPFVGQGLASSYKCLECYFLFEKPPSKKQQDQIKALLPAPLTSFARFRGDVLHFGSDDELELRIKATYEAPHSARPFKKALRDVYAIAKAGDFGDDVLFPRKGSWRAFCDDFERKARAIHAVSRIKLALKPDDDDGGVGPKPGPWHRWSVSQLHVPIEALVAANRKPTPELAYLTVNLLDELPNKMPSHALVAWLLWLDRLRSTGPKELADDGVWDEAAEALFGLLPKRDRARLLASLSKSMRRLLATAQTS